MPTIVFVHITMTLCCSMRGIYILHNHSIPTHSFMLLRTSLRVSLCLVFVRDEPERAPNTRETGSGFIKEVQNVKTVVAEGKISHGRSEDSSDDENFITPPSSPAAERVSLHQCVVQSPDSQIPLKNVKHCNTIIIVFLFYFRRSCRTMRAKDQLVTSKQELQKTVSYLLVYVS
jgi:hypothetical protein